MKSIISYNVNGLRAAMRKGFREWLLEESPDVICLQETKLQPEQLSGKERQPDGYETFWYSAEKKGYSGVAIFTKEPPLNVVYGCGIEKYDQEGRVLRVDYPDFSVLSVYFPSGSSGDHRQAFKEEFLDDFYAYIVTLRKEIPNLVISGDYNICHEAIDIHDPVRNKTVSGFLPQEREWMSRFLELGYVDTFRHFHPETQKFSWWSYRARAREKNKGWRIDYNLVSSSLADTCKAASILGEVVHSDHCPVKVELDL